MRLTVAAPDLVVLSSAVEDATLDGRLLPLLAPFLDGTRTVGEIARALDGRAGLVDVRFGLTLLEDGGWLERDDRPAERPSAIRVDIRGLGATRLSRPRAKDGIQVVLTDDYHSPELDAIDRKARATLRSWIPVKPGRVIWMGPLIEPAASPCWRCVTARLDRSRPLRALFATSPPYGAADRAAPAMSDAAVALVSAVLAEPKEATRTKLRTHIVTMDAGLLTSEWHEVVPDPACPCQRPSGRRRAFRVTLHLRHERKTLIADGGSRTVSAEETFRRYARHISPITGVVRRVEPYHTDPHGLIHVYAADHAFVVDPADREATRRGFRRTSTGKGLTAAQARTSALCEALERHSGVYRGSEPHRRATFETLGNRAIHPNACMGFSERQFAGRAAANRVGRPETWVPQPFQEDTAIAWTEAWSLTHERRRYVPTAYCYYGYPRDPQHDFCRADSNGTAAGNTIAEAILQGFFELVERDAVAIWWYHRLPRPGLDLSALAQPHVRALVEHYDGLGRRLDLVDLTTDFGVKVVAAISRDHRTGRRCTFGFGAHFDVEIAAARAVTEANQFLPAALARTLPDRYGALANQPFLNPSPTARRRVMARPARAERHADRTTDLADDIRRAVAAARDAGLELLVVDQTRPDVGLPVVKVIMPGMRPFWPRFAPGRLYDVPVTLGWLPRAPEEEDLNPVPFFI